MQVAALVMCVLCMCVWAPGKDSNSSLASRVPCSAVYGQAGEQTRSAKPNKVTDGQTDGKRA